MENRNWRNVALLGQTFFWARGPEDSGPLTTEEVAGFMMWVMAPRTRHGSRSRCCANSSRRMETMTEGRKLQKAERGGPPANTQVVTDERLDSVRMRYVYLNRVSPPEKDGLCTVEVADGVWIDFLDGKPLGVELID